jgi:hypothetical protein
LISVAIIPQVWEILGSDFSVELCIIELSIVEPDCYKLTGT